MLKVLLKKQFMEMNQSLFRNRKTGKLRSRAGTIGFLVLFCFLFISIAAAFYGYADLLCGPMVEQGKAWLYFALMGLMALFIGVVGSVFNTYAGLYKAKDTEFLLSMPVAPSSIITSRMLGVYTMSLLFTGIIWVPVTVRYIVAGGRGTGIVFPILLLFILPLLVTVLTCLLGWVVAQVANRVRNKNAATIVATLAFLAVYYVVYFKLNSFLTSVVENSESVAAVMKTWGYPMYRLGMAASGDVVSMVMTTLVTVILFVLLCLLMSRSFLRLSLGGKQAKAAVYKEKPLRASKDATALLGREFKRFTGSPIYLLNCGLGAVFLIAAAVAAVVKADLIRMLADNIGSLIPGADGLASIVVLGIICMFTGLNMITAPSVSLEGKGLWLIRSMPVSTRQVLAAKEKLHVLFNMIPGALCAIACCIVIGADPLSILLVVLASLAFNCVIAAVGLMLDLKRPNLNWTNEATPVKQNLSIFLVMMIEFILSAAILFGGWLLGRIVGLQLALLVITALLGAVFLLLQLWINRRGTVLFEALS